MKHLIDVDEDALQRARRELGTATIKATVNAALRAAAAESSADEALASAFECLSSVEFADRSAAWR